MIIFYDFEFNRLLAEPKVISWQITKHFNKIGTFTARLPLSSRAVELVAERDYLVCRLGGEYLIVTGKEIAGELVLYGRTPNWLLSKRVLLPYSEKTLTTGAFVKEAFEEKFQGCQDVIFGNMAEGQSHSFSSDSPKPLSSAVFDALCLDGLGNELVYDEKNRKWVFNILKGTDKTLLISEGNKNASSVKLTENISDIANVCYYEDDGYKETGEADGLYRFETYITSGKETDAEAKLTDSAKESVLDLSTAGLYYKKDYNLGDKVRVQLIKGDYRTARHLTVTGVEMSSGSGGYREKPIFE